MKDEFGRVIVIEFVGLKSKMRSMKKTDGKECNTAEGVSITTELDKFKDVLFNEKIIRHKMKRIQSKNQEHMKLTKFVRWLIFIKMVSEVVNRLKKIVMIEKDCDD